MKTWLTLQTLLFELGSLYLLGNEQLDWLQWLGYFCSHGLAAASFTLLCWLVLPLRLKRPVAPALLFIFTLAFCIPVLGILGLASIFLLALYFPKPEAKNLWQRTHSLELPIHPEQLETNQYGYAALKDILLFNPSDEKRLMATNSCRFLPPQVAMPLLKLALTDRSDDIRLLAYAAIEKIEFTLNNKIASLQQKIRQTPSAELLHRVAENYWELCYLGIAEGPIRSFYLEQAQHYLEQALKLAPNPGMELKLGRILLEQQQYAAAREHLIKAQQDGLLVKQVTPYLAEILFAEQRYQEIATLLQAVPTGQNTMINELKEYWRRAAS
ncbi:hypothetical protein AGRI_12656 [Alishewanella agri BL06]|uniref:HEAT repeat domain-containing protein n=1 Tax=Alishewanella agri BL06 TaxID=1195246 RepID=I9DPV0_9ALTE|nr:hypothetical protein [Alishewanella agri]EIW88055.1 hypothetical protein AGRI_12656 [Alishewanella agri BL06]